MNMEFSKYFSPKKLGIYSLFLLLSCMSLIWGWLNGAWFGIPRHVLPSFMQGLNFLADPAHSPLACEIAEKLNLPLGTIKSRIFFTRQKLQEELKDFR